MVVSSVLQIRYISYDKRKSSTDEVSGFLCGFIRRVIEVLTFEIQLENIILKPHCEEPDENASHCCQPPTTFSHFNKICLGI